MAKKKPVAKPVKGKATKKQKKVSPQAAGLRNALAKAFPTFAKALAVKPVEGQGNGSKKVKPVIPMTPTVNLLPVEYTIGRTISNVRRGTAIAGTGIAAALGIVFLAQSSVIGIAEQAKLTVEAQVNESNLRIETYKDTAQLYSVLNERKTILENLEKNSPSYYAAINELYAKLPAGTVLTDVSMQHVSLSITGEIEGDPTGVVCGPIADPFASETRPVSACITFSGTAANRADISTYATALSESGLFSNVVLGKSAETNQSSTPNLTAPAGRVSFSGTAAILRDIDPSLILESQGATPTPTPGETATTPTTPGSTPAPTSPTSLPPGVVRDPSGVLYTEDRAFQYVAEQNIYVKVASPGQGDIYAAKPTDKSIDLAGGPIGKVGGNN